jgi:NAD(P)H-dependent FMN reductase
MKIIGLAGSNSHQSINKKLVTYASSLFRENETELLDLNDFEVELYRPDREELNGIPRKISDLASKISNADLIILSLAEHNSSYNASFKNTLDWLSRIPNRKVFDNTSMLLMATSPGARGGKSVLESAEATFPRMAANLKGIFSLPSFNENFDTEKGIITDIEKDSELKEIIYKIVNG